MLDDLFLFDKVKIRDTVVSENEIRIYGDLAEITPCCECGSSERQYSYKYEKGSFRDLDIGNRKVYWDVDIAWYQCSTCKHCYSAISKDFNNVHHFTNRMYAYLSRISITESYDTVSSIFDVSKATVKRMYLSYIRSLMLRKQVGKAKKIIIGDVLVKSTFCRWVADAEMFELIYLMPDCSNDELIERLKGYYGDICPEIIYCSPERELVSLLSKTFEKSVIAIDVVALREVAYSTMSAYKRKYKMSTDLTSEFKDNISIRPYDVNFMNKYLWCKDLLSMTDRNCQLFSVKKHISIGKGQFGDMLWIPYSVFEYCPELLQTYYRNPFNENVKVEYAKFKDVVGKANKCKSLQRAIERILFADKFDKIHNVVSEVEQEKVEVELDSYSGIQKLFNSERYKGLDLYHKMELLKSENVDLYDKALRYF